MRRDSREPFRSRSWTSSLIRSPAIPAAECSRKRRLEVHMQVDADEEERPEHDREERGDDPLYGLDVLEVVLVGGDDDADDEVDQAEKAGAPEPHVCGCTHRAR